MGLIENTFDKLNDRLYDEYNVRFLDKNIPRSKSGKRRRLALSIVALLGAERALKSAKKTKEQMEKNIEKLENTKNENIDDAVEKIEKEQDNIIGKTAVALNYLGQMDGNDKEENDDIKKVNKYPIGSASMILRPWLNWRSMKIRGAVSFVRKNPVPYAVPTAIAASLIPPVSLFLTNPILYVPLPMFEGIVTAVRAIKEKHKIKNKAIVNEDGTRRIGKVVQYNNETGEVKINKKILDSLEPEKVAETVLKGSADVNGDYQTISQLSKSSNEEEFLSAKAESYANIPELNDKKDEVKDEPKNEKKQPQVSTSTESKKEEDVVTSLPSSGDGDYDIVDSRELRDSFGAARSLLKKYALNGEDKKVTDRAVSDNNSDEKVEQGSSIVVEGKKESNEPSSRNEEVSDSDGFINLVREYTKEVDEIRGNFLSELDKRLEKFNNRLNQLNEELRKEREESEKLKAENEELKSRIELSKKEPTMNRIDDDHFEVTDYKSGEPAVWKFSKTTSSNISPDTKIYHRDGSYTIMDAGYASSDSSKSMQKTM